MTFRYRGECDCGWATPWADEPATADLDVHDAVCSSETTLERKWSDRKVEGRA